MKWKEIPKSKMHGCLGIRRIRDFNDCLLIKWWWKFANEEEALWKKVVCSKYNLNGGVLFPAFNQCKRVSKLWGDILAAAEQRLMQFNFFYK